MVKVTTEMSGDPFVLTLIPKGGARFGGELA